MWTTRVHAGGARPGALAAGDGRHSAGVCDRDAGGLTIEVVVPLAFAANLGWWFCRSRLPAVWWACIFAAAADRVVDWRLARGPSPARQSTPRLPIRWRDAHRHQTHAGLDTPTDEKACCANSCARGCGRWPNSEIIGEGQERRRGPCSSPEEQNPDTGVPRNPHAPGMTGIEAARAIRETMTTDDDTRRTVARLRDRVQSRIRQYAIEAFEQGVDSRAETARARQDRTVDGRAPQEAASRKRRQRASMAAPTLQTAATKRPAAPPSRRDQKLLQKSSRHAWKRARRGFALEQATFGHRTSR